LTGKLILSNVSLSDAAKSRLLDAIDGKMEFEIESEPSPERLRDVEILILAGKAWLTKERLEKMENLRLIQCFSAGVEYLNHEIIPASVIVCSNAGAFAEPIVEFVFGSIVCLGRNLIEHDRKMKQGVFEQSPFGLFLKGKTIGVIGTGGIGQNVARVAKSFNMRTLGINTSGQSVPYFDSVSKLDNLESFLKESDIVVVAVPLTNRTKDLIGERELNHVKPDSIIINVARGAIINERALYNFLSSHPESRAAIDVWWRYPRTGEKFAQNTPIETLPNVLASPHFSDGVPESFELGSESAINNVIRYLKGEPLKGRVRSEDYYGLNHAASHP